jgi:tripartite-type tricarboxylate transporter receptor subunit TctC
LSADIVGFIRHFAMLSSLEKPRGHGRLLVRLGVVLASFAALLCSLPSAAAQDYPSRPIRVITVTSAGGTSDIFMRALADEIHKGLGQPIVIENRPGGAFNIGARACAEAAPDGYTICILPGEPIVFNQFLFKSLAFDPAAFEPVTQLFTIVQALVVSKALNVGTMQGLTALSKAKPGTLNYSTGSVPFGVFFDRINREAGADIVRVPFRGGGEAVNALMTGATPVGFLGLSNVRGQMEAGLVTGLMVDSDRRSPLFPDMPTIPEATGREYASRSYFGLVAPPGTPKPVTARLQAEIARIAAQPDFLKKNFIERGLDPVASTPEAFARFIQQDRALAAQIVKEAGLEPQ